MYHPLDIVEEYGLFETKENIEGKLKTIYKTRNPKVDKFELTLTTLRQYFETRGNFDNLSDASAATGLIYCRVLH